MRPCEGVKQLAHTRFADPRTVRRGVEETECGLHGSPRVCPLEFGLERTDRFDPHIDVGELEPADFAATGSVEVSPLPFLHHDEGRIVEREVNVPTDQRIDGLAWAACRRCALLAGLEQLRADLRKRPGEDLVLSGEVLVERGSGNPTCGTDVVDRHTMESPFGEKLGSGVQDLLFAIACHQTSVDQSG